MFGEFDLIYFLCKWEINDIAFFAVSEIIDPSKIQIGLPFYGYRWKSGFEKFGDDWQVSVNRIIDINGDREKDWILYDHPDLKTKKNDLTQCLLPYHLNSKYMYISGAYFCVKYDFFKNNQLNKNLFWGEGEDVEWSLRVREKTRFCFNPFSIVQFNKIKYNINPATKITINEVSNVPIIASTINKATRFLFFANVTNA